MSAISEELVAAYRATLYRVTIADVTLELRIGRPSGALDRLMRAQGVTEAAIVTAYNPRSIPLCEAENRAAHETLLHAAQARGYRFGASEARDPDGAWPPEPGLCLLGVGREAVAELARAFRQNAFVFLREGEAPELVLLG